MNNNNKNNLKTVIDFVGHFLEGLDSRHQDVLKSRYGLHGGEPMTLQAIGDKYKITRERVRQIEAASLALLKEKKDHPYFASFITEAANTLKNAGGIQKENEFLRVLRENLRDNTPEASFVNHARFLLELSGEFLNFRDLNSKEHHPHWHLSEKDKKRAHDFALKFEAALAKNKSQVLEKNDFYNQIFSSLAKSMNLSDQVAQSYLGISKKFGKGPFGQIGLADWAEINPKTAKDWAYTVLKKEKKALHFTELSDIISRQRKEKRTNLQTVHNELIKDDRFVLVGRGMYGLREFGLIPGTAREIITHVLKENGPLHPKDVVRLVNSQRFFKEGTILINLQNRKHFELAPDGRYFLAKA